MKLNKFFMLGLAGLAFTACSNNDDAIDNSKDGKVQMTISVGRTEAARSIGQSAAGLYNKIDDISIVFYNGNGAYVANPTVGKVGTTECATEEDLYKAIVVGLNQEAHKVTVELKEIPASASQIYIVANQKGKAEIGRGASLAEAKKTPISLKNTQIEGFEQFSGEKSRLTGLAKIIDGVDQAASAQVQLRPVPSRIEMGTVTALSKPEAYPGTDIKSFTVAGFYINRFYIAGYLDPSLGMIDDVIDNDKDVEKYTSNAYGEWKFMCNEPQQGEMTEFVKGDDDTTIGFVKVADDKFYGYQVLQGDPVHVVVKLNVTYIDNLTETKFLTITRYTYSSTFTEPADPTNPGVQPPTYAPGTPVGNFFRGHVYKIGNIEFNVSDLTDVPYETTKTVTANVEVRPWVGVDVKPGFN